MKLKELIKLFSLITIIFFFILYFTTVGGYYEYNLSKKNALTEEAIARFEQDVKDGKKIVASNYIQKEKDYHNKATNISNKLAKLITTFFDKTMKFIFSQIEKAINS